MKNALSVFFGIDRTYVSVMRPTPKGLALDFIDATRNAVDLENPFDDASKAGEMELNEFIEENKDKVEKINVTIPAEMVFVTQFPGQPGMSVDELRQLVDLEIRQAFPQFNPEEFVTTITPMEQTKDGIHMMMATIVQRDILDTIKEIFQNKMPVQDIEISQLNAHSSFLYNYPEAANKTIMIFGIQEQFIDVSIVKNTKPAYYNLLSLSNPDKLGEMFEEEFNKVKETTVEQIDGAYFFGMGLTKELYFHAWETSMAIGLETGRMNAFRMVTTDLDKRRKDYCSRIMHIAPPCIGAHIPAYHERIRLI